MANYRRHPIRIAKTIPNVGTVPIEVSFTSEDPAPPAIGSLVGVRFEIVAGPGTETQGDVLQSSGGRELVQVPAQPNTAVNEKSDIARLYEIPIGEEIVANVQTDDATAQTTVRVEITVVLPG